MREIKFRAWNKSVNEMAHMDYEGEFNFDCASDYNLSEAVMCPSSIMLMQFTGLKDKNGVDVYEGDIVEFDREEWGDDENIHTVSWSERDASWCFGGGTSGDMHFRAVIGNIYQQPELIAQTC